MPSYELLDRIADSINPAMGILALALPWLRKRERSGQVALMTSFTLACVAIAYGMQWLDRSFRLWPHFGLDYSTHTAVFAAIASALWQHGRVWQYFAVGVALSYAALMLWQRYHSLMDIVSTAGAMLVVLIVFWSLVRRALPVVRSLQG